MNTIVEFFYTCILLFSAVMAFIYRKHLETRKIFIMLPYLLLVFVQETVLLILFVINTTLHNSIVYNIYQPVTVIVFASIYFRLPIMAPYKKLIAGTTLLYLLAAAVNYSFFESIFSPSSYLPLVRGLVITFYGLLFLSRYFNLDSSTEEKFWRPLLWITTGIVTFYPVISISITFQKILAVNQATLYGLKLYQVIPQLMSIFMYSCFSYAFYLCRKKN